MKDLNKILNGKNQRRDLIKANYKNQQAVYLKRRHLNWKEKRQERALRYKALRNGLTKEERTELEDLNYVEVLAQGQVQLHQEIFYVGGYCNNFVFKGY
ncbi:hypothetical protein Glove_59g43 [Diversispora epigaea]|uniref:Uncharacterized protein n=1 Tax=Diversispora epigaea TaxID=1348612 RepID=A0A397JGE7_9GLOM|nr:hypothetical protein Glove_59g43 [Diversispora epigaea]